MQKQTDVKLAIRMLAIIAVLTMAGCKSSGNKDRTWSVYKADEHSSGYSPLDQITVSNVSALKPVWTFEFNDAPQNSRPALNQNNPIIVDGILYATSARLLAYAIDAATGEKLWAYDPFDGGEGNGPLRGVTYWESGRDKRILFSADNHLIALNALTGKPVESFGEKGKVNLNIGLRDDPEKIAVSLTTPGIIYKDLIIIGSRLPDVYDAPPGYIRAYDCRTGQLIWTFHTIPHPEEPGYETWPKDAYKYAGGANNWAGMALDNKRGIVYIPLGSPSYDFYAADREGENLYGNSILALDASTGNYIWHYQIVHHDIWDYDLPAPPNLVTVHRDGRDIDAVVQLTKHGFVFVFDRETGEPLFPIEERAVPQSNMPGEKSWPTQPFPLKPAPFARQTMTEADLTRYSDADHEALVERFRSLRYEGLFTPPDLKGTLMMPGTRGGAEWGGAAYDPATSMLYFKSNDAPDIQTIVQADGNQAATGMTVADHGQVLYTTYCASCHGNNREGISPTYPGLIGLKDRMNSQTILDKIQKGVGVMPGFGNSMTSEEQEAILAFVSGMDQSPIRIAKAIAEQPGDKSLRFMNITGYQTFRDPNGNPALAPPWGTLHALNLSTGEYEWQIPLGNDKTRQLPGMPETGQESKAGPIVTAGGLIFIAATEDRKFRAFGKSGGKVLWETTLPALANATACTYQVGDKQYVAIAVGGTEDKPAGSVMAFALP